MSGLQLNFWFVLIGLAGLVVFVGAPGERSQAILNEMTRLADQQKVVNRETVRISTPTISPNSKELTRAEQIRHEYVKLSEEFRNLRRVGKVERAPELGEYVLNAFFYPVSIGKYVLAEAGIDKFDFRKEMHIQTRAIETKNMCFEMKEYSNMDFALDTFNENYKANAEVYYPCLNYFGAKPTTSKELYAISAWAELSRLYIIRAFIGHQLNGQKVWWDPFTVDLFASFYFDQLERGVQYTKEDQLENPTRFFASGLPDHITKRIIASIDQTQLTYLRSETVPRLLRGSAINARIDSLLYEYKSISGTSSIPTQ